MIEFLSAAWKNFLSTGNSPNEIQLDAAPTTLIMGFNGHGKSTILDVLCFCLYGKPFRNISKHQLVNSKNGKNAQTQVTFKTQGKTYKVIRTIKPNNFEIYCDDVLLTQDAAIKDYQKVLEQQILKMNFKTFTQVVILGSSSFTPFMQLSAGHRREVIDDILDIKILTIMGSVLKAQIVETKEALKENGYTITSLKQEVASQKKLIDTIEAANKSRDVEIAQELDKLDQSYAILEGQQTNLGTKITHLADFINNHPYSQAALTNAVNSQYKLGLIMSQLDDKLDFFNGHDTCPSCEQNISLEHKSVIVEKALTEHQCLEADLQRENTTVGQLREWEREFTEAQKKHREFYTQFQSITDKITCNRLDHASLVSRRAVSNTVGDIDKERAALKDLAAKVVAALEEKVTLTEQRNMQDIAAAMLKDGGIKSKIIKEYLPMMNKLINKYLQVQDSFIQFEMDEEFNETIKSRYRDEFTYASFSEGEKQRIDLAILFTWRQIARLKNSANTNLLFLDEIMDGSLDSFGAESAQQLIDSLAADGTHVFVVSHTTDTIADKFDRILRFEKKNDYSTVQTIS